MKKIVKILLTLLLAIVLVVLGYIGYLFISYQRVADNKSLSIKTAQQLTLKKKTDYRAMTYNIGYGSYPPNYSFFMDGGTKSRADSPAVVKNNLNGILKTTKKIDPTLAFYQEVDQDGDRSQHVNEVSMIQQTFSNYNSVYGQNYDSAYLFYPLTEPIGKAKSGLVTLSQGLIKESTRYSLPIETNINKFFDLDRAFTVSRIPVKDGHDLIAINTHLSAYTKNKAVQKAQLAKLFNFIESEYQKGNYVLTGGDFNHDTLGNSPDVFNTSQKRLSWTHPFPKSQLPAGITMPNGKLAAEKIPSARNLNEPYQPQKTMVTLIDGFLVSDNISVKAIHVQDTGFKNSDHNPVYLDFSLN